MLCYSTSALNRLFFSVMNIDFFLVVRYPIPCERNTNNQITTEARKRQAIIRWILVHTRTLLWSQEWKWKWCSYGNGRMETEGIGKPTINFSPYSDNEILPNRQRMANGEKRDSTKPNGTKWISGVCACAFVFVLGLYLCWSAIWNAGWSRERERERKRAAKCRQFW